MYDTYSQRSDAYSRSQRSETYSRHGTEAYSGSRHGTDAYSGRPGFDMRSPQGAYGLGVDTYGSHTRGSSGNDFGVGGPSHTGSLGPSHTGSLPTSQRQDYGSGRSYADYGSSRDMGMPPPSYSQTLPTAFSRTSPSHATSSGSRQLPNVDENSPHEAPLEAPHQRLAELSGQGDDGRPRDRPPRPHRTMSYLSQEAIDGLFKTGEEVTSLEERAQDVNRRFDSGELTSAQAVSELAQVEAAANKVECKGIDSIYTGELNTGKDEAKALKKDQNKRLDSLHTKFEELFRKFKSRA